MLDRSRVRSGDAARPFCGRSLLDQPMWLGARRGRCLTAPQIPGRPGQASHVLDHSADLRVVQDEPEGRHSRLAEARATVADEIGQVSVGKGRDRVAREIAGSQKEQARSPGVPAACGSVAGRAVGLEEGAARFRPPGRRRQRRADQGHAGDEKRQHTPGDSRGQYPPCSHGGARRPKSSGVSRTSGSWAGRVRTCWTAARTRTAGSPGAPRRGVRERQRVRAPTLFDSLLGPRVEEVEALGVQ
jgi:hypothetical protein